MERRIGHINGNLCLELSIIAACSKINYKILVIYYALDTPIFIVIMMYAVFGLS